MRVRRPAVICEAHRCLRNLHFPNCGGFRRLRRRSIRRGTTIVIRCLCAIILCLLREYFGSTSNSVRSTKVTGIPLIIKNTLSSAQEWNSVYAPFPRPTGSTFLSTSISPGIIYHFFGPIKVWAFIRHKITHTEFSHCLNNEGKVSSQRSWIEARVRVQHNMPWQSTLSSSSSLRQWGGRRENTGHSYNATIRM